MTQQLHPRAVLSTVEIGAGFLDKPLDPCRYDGHSFDPCEVVGRLCTLVPSGSRVLDVGCGTGSVSTLVSQHVKGDFLGIEPDPQRAQAARRRGLKVLDGYLTPDTFREHGQFNVIMFADVLEHLADLAAILEIAKPGLKPGGCIIASVPNVAHWSVRLALLIGRFEYQPTGIMDTTHLRWFTRRTLKRFLAAEGLQCDRILPTAGVAMPIYSRLPFRALPRVVRNPIIRVATALIPRVMACQFVVRAYLTASK